MYNAKGIELNLQDDSRELMQYRPALSSNISIWDNLRKKLNAFFSYIPFSRIGLYLTVLEMLIFVFIGIYNVAILYSICNGKNCTSSMKSLGKRLGVLTHWNYLILLIPITRNGICYYIFRIPYERMILFHKWIGRWICILLIFHTVALGYASYESGGWEQVWGKFTKLDIIYGELSFILLVIILISSLYYVRRAFFEWFMKLHFLLFPFVLIFAFLHPHGTNLLKMLSVPLILYVLDYAIRFTYVIGSKAHIGDLEILGQNYYKFKLSGFGRYKPGQYVYLYIPAVSKFQIHPFSVYSAPDSNKPQASLLIHANGTWTKKLQHLLIHHPDQVQYAWVDGGYGSSAIAPPEHYPFVVFIAGGVGVTPILSMLAKLRQNVRSRTRPVPVRIMVIWASRTLELFIGMKPELDRVVESFDPETLSIDLYLTSVLNLKPDSDEARSPIFQNIHQQRPHFKQIFRNVISQARSSGISSVGVYVCGSAKMTGPVLQQARSEWCCNSSVVVDIHSESFGL